MTTSRQRQYVAKKLSASPELSDKQTHTLSIIQDHELDEGIQEFIEPFLSDEYMDGEPYTLKDILIILAADVFQKRCCKLDFYDYAVGIENYDDWSKTSMLQLELAAQKAGIAGTGVDEALDKIEHHKKFLNLLPKVINVITKLAEEELLTAEDKKAFRVLYRMIDSGLNRVAAHTVDNSTDRESLLESIRKDISGETFTFRNSTDHDFIAQVYAEEVTSGILKEASKLKADLTDQQIQEKLPKGLPDESYTQLIQDFHEAIRTRLSNQPDQINVTQQVFEAIKENQITIDLEGLNRQLDRGYSSPHSRSATGVYKVALDALKDIASNLNIEHVGRTR